MKNKALVIIVLAAMFGSCQRRTGEPTRHVSIDQKIANYYNWKTGSYWIFLDSLTGKKDSFVLFDSHVSNNVGSDDTYDISSISIKEFYDTSVTYKVWGITMDASSQSVHLYYYDNQQSFQISVSYDVNPFTLASGNAILPTLSAASQNYSDVLLSASQSDKIFLNADSGFIQLSLNNRFAHRNLIVQNNHIIH